MTTTNSTARTPRASCRVGCVIAALLVTLGGLRLLVAAEPAQVVDAVRLEAAAVSVRVRLPAPAEVGTYRITTSDFAAAVEHASRRIECIPGACGFPRVRDLDAAALDWTALEERVTAALLPTFEIEESQGQRALPEEWVPGSACRLGCGGALRTPDALAAHF